MQLPQLAWVRGGRESERHALCLPSGRVLLRPCPICFVLHSHNSSISRGNKKKLVQPSHVTSVTDVTVTATVAVTVTCHTVTVTCGAHIARSWRACQKKDWILGVHRLLNKLEKKDVDILYQYANRLVKMKSHTKLNGCRRLLQNGS